MTNSTNEPLSTWDEVRFALRDLPRGRANRKSKNLGRRGISRPVSSEDPVEYLVKKMQVYGFEPHDAGLLCHSAKKCDVGLNQLKDGWMAGELGNLNPSFHWLWIQANMFSDKPENLTKARRLVGAAGSEELGAWAGAAFFTPEATKKMVETEGGNIDVQFLKFIAAFSDRWVTYA